MAVEVLTVFYAGSNNMKANQSKQDTAFEKRFFGFM